MRFEHWVLAAVTATMMSSAAAEFSPARQWFRQETARQFSGKGSLPAGAVQLIDFARNGLPRAFLKGQWYEYQRDHWQLIPELTSKQGEFVFADQEDRPVAVSVPWQDV